MKTEDPYGGRAELREDAGGLYIKVRARRYWGLTSFRRRRAFDLAHVSNIRAGKDEGVSAFRFDRHAPQGLFSGWGEGVIRFDYGIWTLGFGLDLDAAEAAQLAARLRARLGAER